MTDPRYDRAATTTDGPPANGGSAPGWYPDPWSGAHHRYWDGAAWTGDSFPHGTMGAGPPDPGPAPGWYPPAATPTRHTDTPPPPPAWSTPVATTATWARPWPAPTPPPARSRSLPTGAGFVALVVVIMLVVGSLGVVGGYFALAKRSARARVATGPGPSLPVTPTDPAASVLSGLVVTQADVEPSVIVAPLAGGTRVAGQPTLDLCNGTFPSEALRTARLQVEALDSQATRLLSTEAVLYSSGAGTAQGFSELTATAAACPATPVESPVGEPTTTTKFAAAPDASWAQVATVDRLAYDFMSTDDTGTVDHTVAVYLRRGRVLMGVYFAQPDGPQASVAGQTTIAGIVNVFAARMAQLPGSVVNG